MTSTARRSPLRLGLAGLLLLVYGVPLFWPPPPAAPDIPPDAWLLQRLFPGVPATWVAVRLGALALAATLLAGSTLPAGARRARAGASGARGLRWLALGVAVAQAASAPWASRLGPAGQVGYVIMLFVPAALLALPTSSAIRLPPARRWRRALPVAAVIVAWTVARLGTDLHSRRLADMTDAWCGFYAIALFVAQRKNVLTDLLFSSFPGVGGEPMLFHGVPLFQAGVLPLAFPTVQMFQIFWIALTAAGVAVLARLLVGRGAAVIAVAVFLFAPFTRMETFFPCPLIVGPMYSTAVALCGLLAWQRRSEAALAALGACSGFAVTYPGVLPIVPLVVIVTAWHLRDRWRELWVGWAAGLAAFVAVVAPTIPVVFATTRMTRVYGAMYGVTQILEPVFMGQLPLGMVEVSKQTIVRRPLDTVVAAVLAPFVHPRMPIKLWGDALFDPIGAGLLAVGLVACFGSVLDSAAAVFLLLLFGAALSPAFVSPLDRVDIAHAVALPVPVALLAAAGFAVLRRRVGGARTLLPLALVGAICLGGTVLFDAVNPRILRASALGIMFRVLEPDVAERVIVVSYRPSFSPETFWLFTGPITAYAGERPVGLLEYDGGGFPADDLAAEGKDLLFWSPGVEADLGVTAAVCAQWPDAMLYEVRDDTGLDRVYAARVGGRAWEPHTAADRWRRRTCASR